jgi:hypothetical protein
MCQFGVKVTEPKDSRLYIHRELFIERIRVLTILYLGCNAFLIAASWTKAGWGTLAFLVGLAAVVLAGYGWLARATSRRVGYILVTDGGGYLVCSGVRNGVVLFRNGLQEWRWRGGGLEVTYGEGFHCSIRASEEVMPLVVKTLRRWGIHELAAIEDSGVTSKGSVG